MSAVAGNTESTTPGSGSVGSLGAGVQDERTKTKPKRTPKSRTASTDSIILTKQSRPASRSASSDAESGDQTMLIAKKKKSNSRRPSSSENDSDSLEVADFNERRKTIMKNALKGSPSAANSSTEIIDSPLSMDESINTKAAKRISKIGRKKSILQSLAGPVGISEAYAQLEQLLAQPPSRLPHGLSSSVAQKQLVAAVDDVLMAYRAKQPTISALFVQFLMLPHTIFTLLLGGLMIAYFSITITTSNTTSNPYQFRATGAVVEGMLVLFAYVYNLRLFILERRLEYIEPAEAAKQSWELLKTCDFTKPPDTNVPSLLGMSVIEVVRDGKVFKVPFTMLVQGDIVRSAYGSVAPGKMELMAGQGQNENDPVLVFERGDCVHPSLLPAKQRSVNEPPVFYFTMHETPLIQQLETVLHSKRPVSVMENQRIKLQRMFTDWVLWITYAISIVVNFFRVFFLHNLNDWADLMFLIPAQLMLTLLPLAFPILWLAFSCYANSWLYCLFDALQSSKTSYSDNDDEFDFEEEAPVKEVFVPRVVIFRRFVKMMLGTAPETLSRTANLLHCLGNTTVICAIDKEGTLAKPFPLPEQIFFLRDEPTTLEVGTDKNPPHKMTFLEKDWNIVMSSLKPVGLNALLNTDLLTDLPGPYQFKRPNLSELGAGLIALNMYLGQLGRAMGFVDNGLTSFCRRKHLYAYCPDHPSLKRPPAFGPVELNSILPVSMGGGIKETVEKDQATLDEQSDPPDPRLFGQNFTMAAMASVILEDTNSKSFQLLTEGHPELVLDYCSEYWDGTEIKRLDDDARQKILRFYNNTRARGFQCVSLAYVPLHLSEDSPLLKQLPQFNESGSKDENVINQPLWVQIPPDPTRAALDASHPYHGFEIILSGQIYIGTVVLQNETKQDMPEFIEDLSVTGIHFSMFSRSHERSAKAFAEGLGVATDWNCCISLNPDMRLDIINRTDKAQMPHGVMKIRPHLEDVDDIPLRLPIFANSDADSIREMIRIYQENGEVVCCLGNSADGNNARIFATADVSMSFEMLHPRLFLNNMVASPTPSEDFGRATGNAFIGGRDFGQKHYTTNPTRLLQGDPESPFHLPHNTAEPVRIQRRDSRIGTLSSHSAENSNHPTRPAGYIDSKEQPRVHADGSMIPSMAFVNAKFNTLPCAFRISRDTSPYVIMEVIREARRLNRNVQQAMAFMLAVHLSLAILVLLNQLLLLPPIFNGYQMLWVMWIQVPLVSSSFLSTPYEPDLMKQMPLKNLDHVAALPHFVLYYFIRYSPLIAVCLLVFVATVQALVTPTPTLADIFLSLSTSSISWSEWSMETQWAILYAQNIALFVFIFYTLAMSSTLLSRTLPIFKFNPLRNKTWIIQTLISLVLQTVFIAISLGTRPAELSSVSLANIPSWVYCVALLAIIPIMAIEELMKIPDRAIYEKHQKRTKLFFQTKLGMHSPV